MLKMEVIGMFLFRRIRRLIRLFILLAIIGCIIYGNKSISITEYTISDTKIPESFSGYRIAHISDLHNAKFGKDNKRLIEQIRKQAPDIIVLTGDLVDSRHTDISVAISFAKQVAAIAPTYYVTGNHEGRLDDPEDFLEELKATGVILLLDDSVVLQRNGDKILLAGLTDPTLRQDTTESGMRQALNDQIADSDLYTIVLSHNPEYFPVYTACEADLVLSGHLHGGQFRLPGIGGVYAPGQGFFPKLDAGLYKEGRTDMIISRGLGNSAFPFRLNNRPEIVLITLEHKN